MPGLATFGLASADQAGAGLPLARSPLPIVGGFQSGDFVFFGNVGNQFPLHFDKMGTFIEELPHGSGVPLGASGSIDGVFSTVTGDFFSTEVTLGSVIKWDSSALVDAAWATFPAGDTTGGHSTIWPGPGNPYGLPWGSALYSGTLYVGSLQYPNIAGGVWVLGIDINTGTIAQNFGSLAPIGSGIQYTWPALSPDGTILYYVNGDDNSGSPMIGRWDIGGSTQLTNLPGPNNIDVVMMRTLSNGNLFLSGFDISTLHIITTIIDSSGTQLAQVDQSALLDSLVPDYETRINAGLPTTVMPDANDPNSVWVVTFYTGLISPTPSIYIHKVDVFAGTVIGTLNLTAPSPLDVGFVSGLAQIFQGIVVPPHPGLTRYPQSGVDPITGAKWGPPLV